MFYLNIQETHFFQAQASVFCKEPTSLFHHSETTSNAILKDSQIEQEGNNPSSSGCHEEMLGQMFF